MIRFALMALAVASLTSPALASSQQKTTTTQQAADAAKRQGQTGTTNQNAAKQLQEMEKQDAKPSATPAKKK